MELPNKVIASYFHTLNEPEGGVELRAVLENMHNASQIQCQNNQEHPNLRSHIIQLLYAIYNSIPTLTQTEQDSPQYRHIAGRFLQSVPRLLTLYYSLSQRSIALCKIVELIRDKPLWITSESEDGLSCHPLSQIPTPIGQSLLGNFSILYLYRWDQLDILLKDRIVNGKAVLSGTASVSLQLTSVYRFDRSTSSSENLDLALDWLVAKLLHVSALPGYEQLQIELHARITPYLDRFISVKKRSTEDLPEEAYAPLSDLPVFGFGLKTRFTDFYGLMKWLFELEFSAGPDRIYANLRFLVTAYDASQAKTSPINRFIRKQLADILKECGEHAYWQIAHVQTWLLEYFAKRTAADPAYTQAFIAVAHNLAALSEVNHEFGHLIIVPGLTTYFSSPKSSVQPSEMMADLSPDVLEWYRENERIDQKINSNPEAIATVAARLETLSLQFKDLVSHIEHACAWMTGGVSARTNEKSPKTKIYLPINPACLDSNDLVNTALGALLGGVCLKYVTGHYPTTLTWSRLPAPLTKDPVAAEQVLVRLVRILTRENKDSFLWTIQSLESVVSQLNLSGIVPYFESHPDTLNDFLTLSTNKTICALFTQYPALIVIAITTDSHWKLDPEQQLWALTVLTHWIQDNTNVSDILKLPDQNGRLKEKYRLPALLHFLSGINASDASISFVFTLNSKILSVLAKKTKAIRAVIEAINSAIQANHSLKNNAGILNQMLGDFLLNAVPAGCDPMKSWINFPVYFSTAPQQAQWEKLLQDIHEQEQQDLFKAQAHDAKRQAEIFEAKMAHFRQTRSAAIENYKSQCNAVMNEINTLSKEAQKLKKQFLDRLTTITPQHLWISDILAQFQSVLPDFENAYTPLESETRQLKTAIQALLNQNKENPKLLENDNQWMQWEAEFNDKYASLLATKDRGKKITQTLQTQLQQITDLISHRESNLAVLAQYEEIGLKVEWMSNGRCQINRTAPVVIDSALANRHALPNLAQFLELNPEAPDTLPSSILDPYLKETSLNDLKALYHKCHQTIFRFLVDSALHATATLWVDRYSKEIDTTTTYHGYIREMQSLYADYTQFMEDSDNPGWAKHANALGLKALLNYLNVPTNIATPNNPLDRTFKTVTRAQEALIHRNHPFTRDISTLGQDLEQALLLYDNELCAFLKTLSNNRVPNIPYLQHKQGGKEFGTAFNAIKTSSAKLEKLETLKAISTALDRITAAVFSAWYEELCSDKDLDSEINTGFPRVLPSLPVLKPDTLFEDLDEMIVSANVKTPSQIVELVKLFRSLFRNVSDPLRRVTGTQLSTFLQAAKEQFQLTRYTPISVSPEKAETLSNETLSALFVFEFERNGDTSEKWVPVRNRVVHQPERPRHPADRKRMIDYLVSHSQRPSSKPVETQVISEAEIELWLKWILLLERFAYPHHTSADQLSKWCQPDAFHTMANAQQLLRKLRGWLLHGK